MRLRAMKVVACSVVGMTAEMIRQLFYVVADWKHMESSEPDEGLPAIFSILMQIAARAPKTCL